jgi:hypothetical protein
MAVSLKEFRDRFPDANILSDVLAIEKQQFVVRVTIQTRDAGTVTGLSAHASLEIAEDQARQRALQALGLGPQNRLSTLSPEVSNAAIVPAAAAAAAEEPEHRGEPTPDPEPLRAVDDEASETRPTASSAPAVRHPPPVTTATVPAPAPAPSPRLPASGSQDEPDQPFDTQPATTKPQTTGNLPPSTSGTEAIEPIPVAALPAPINLSDVIAQTDIELRRLGWSVETGRDYLEQTYNKRSRHELSEEELIQFLCYLEGLPEPQTAP